MYKEEYNKGKPAVSYTGKRVYIFQKWYLRENPLFPIHTAQILGTHLLL
jgi:hypothetical protein